MLERLERALWRAARLNPCVMVHELRLRMRTGRAFVQMFLFVLLCSVAVVGPVVHHMVVSAAAGPGDPASVRELGRLSLMALVMVLLTLLAFVVPAYAATGIAGERDRDTLAMLRATMLSASDVVLGKFGAVAAYTVMLILLAAPLASWTILVGAVSPGEVAELSALLVAFGLALAGISTWLSALCRSPVAAVARSYILLLVIFGGAPLLQWLFRQLGSVSRMMFEEMASFVIFTIPTAITAWLIAALVRWVVFRAGRLPDARSQAVLGTVIFFIAIVALINVFEPAVSGSLHGSLVVRVIPYVVANGVLNWGDASAWPFVWGYLTIAAAGCLLAVRCLKLREFRPVKYEDIFEQVWLRVRALRPSRQDA
ncbi:MAG: ABC transporter permease [Armatimonadota bacterium]